MKNIPASKVFIFADTPLHPGLTGRQSVSQTSLHDFRKFSPTPATPTPHIPSSLLFPLPSSHPFPTTTTTTITITPPHPSVPVVGCQSLYLPNSRPYHVFLILGIPRLLVSVRGPLVKRLILLLSESRMDRGRYRPAGCPEWACKSIKRFFKCTMPSQCAAEDYSCGRFSGGSFSVFGRV